MQFYALQVIPTCKMSKREDGKYNSCEFQLVCISFSFFLHQQKQ